MPVARCPVCEDIITIGVICKLYQPVTCPTCLANLEIVSLNPFELDLPTGVKRSGPPRNGQSANARKSKNGPANRPIGDYFGGEDESDDYDDYLLERRQRHKSDRDRRRRGTD